MPRRPPTSAEPPDAPRRSVGFYKSTLGAAAASDDLAGLGPAAEAKLVVRLRMFADRDPRVRAEKVAEDLFEIKTRLGNLQPRALVTIQGEHDEEIVVLHCLMKKDRSIRDSDINLAKQRLADLKARSGG